MPSSYGIRVDESPFACLQALCSAGRSFLGPIKSIKCIIDPKHESGKSSLVATLEDFLIAIDGDPTCTTLLLDALQHQDKTYGNGSSWLATLASLLATRLSEVLHDLGYDTAQLPRFDTASSRNNNCFEVNFSLDTAFEDVRRAIDECLKEMQTLAVSAYPNLGTKGTLNRGFMNGSADKQDRSYNDKSSNVIRLSDCCNNVTGNSSIPESIKARDECGKDDGEKEGTVGSWRNILSNELKDAMETKAVGTLIGSDENKEKVQNVIHCCCTDGSDEHRKKKEGENVEEREEKEEEDEFTWMFDEGEEREGDGKESEDGRKGENEKEWNDGNEENDEKEKEKSVERNSNEDEGFRDIYKNLDAKPGESKNKAMNNQSHVTDDSSGLLIDNQHVNLHLLPSKSIAPPCPLNSQDSNDVSWFFSGNIGSENLDPEKDSNFLSFLKETKKEVAAVLGIDSSSEESGSISDSTSIIEEEVDTGKRQGIDRGKEQKDKASAGDVLRRDKEVEGKEENDDEKGNDGIVSLDPESKDEIRRKKIQKLEELKRLISPLAWKKKGEGEGGKGKEGRDEGGEQKGKEKETKPRPSPSLEWGNDRSRGEINKEIDKEFNDGSPWMSVEPPSWVLQSLSGFPNALFPEKEAQTLTNSGALEKDSSSHVEKMKDAQEDNNIGNNSVLRSGDMDCNNKIQIQPNPAFQPLEHLPLIRQIILAVAHRLVGIDINSNRFADDSSDIIQSRTGIINGMDQEECDVDMVEEYVAMDAAVKCFLSSVDCSILADFSRIDQIKNILFNKMNGKKAESIFKAEVDQVSKTKPSITIKEEGIGKKGQIKKEEGNGVITGKEGKKPAIRRGFFSAKPKSSKTQTNSENIIQLKGGQGGMGEVNSINTQMLTELKPPPTVFSASSTGEKTEEGKENCEMLIKNMKENERKAIIDAKLHDIKSIWSSHSALFSSLSLNSNENVVDNNNFDNCNEEHQNSVSSNYGVQYLLRRFASQLKWSDSIKVLSVQGRVDCDPNFKPRLFDLLTVRRNSGSQNPNTPLPHDATLVHPNLVTASSARAYVIPGFCIPTHHLTPWQANSVDKLVHENSAGSKIDHSKESRKIGSGKPSRQGHILNLLAVEGALIPPNVDELLLSPSESLASGLGKEKEGRREGDLHVERVDKSKLDRNKSVRFANNDVNYVDDDSDGDSDHFSKKSNLIPDHKLSLEYQLDPNKRDFEIATWLSSFLLADGLKADHHPLYVGPKMIETSIEKGKQKMDSFRNVSETPGHLNEGLEAVNVKCTTPPHTPTHLPIHPQIVLVSEAISPTVSSILFERTGILVIGSLGTDAVRKSAAAIGVEVYRIGSKFADSHNHPKNDSRNGFPFVSAHNDINRSPNTDVVHMDRNVAHLNENDHNHSFVNEFPRDLMSYIAPAEIQLIKSGFRVNDVVAFGEKATNAVLDERRGGALPYEWTSDRDEIVRQAHLGGVGSGWAFDEARGSEESAASQKRRSRGGGRRGGGEESLGVKGRTGYILSICAPSISQEAFDSIAPIFFHPTPSDPIPSTSSRPVPLPNPTDSSSKIDSPHSTNPSNPTNQPKPTNSLYPIHPSPQPITVIVAASTRVALEGMENRIQSAFHKLRNALVTGQGLPGGGAWEICCAAALRTRASCIMMGHEGGREGEEARAEIARARKGEDETGKKERNEMEERGKEIKHKNEYETKGKYVKSVLSRLQVQIDQDPMRKILRSKIYVAVADALEDLVLTLYQNSGNHMTLHSGFEFQDAVRAVCFLRNWIQGQREKKSNEENEIQSSAFQDIPLIFIKLVEGLKQAKNIYDRHHCSKTSQLFEANAWVLDDLEGRKAAIKSAMNLVLFTMSIGTVITNYQDETV